VLMSAEDHLRTVLMLLQHNVLPMFSLYSLLRPAAEADVRVAHLLDPAIDETQRLARGLKRAVRESDCPALLAQTRPG
jgi:hypothetical protein